MPTPPAPAADRRRPVDLRPLVPAGAPRRAGRAARRRPRRRRPARRQRRDHRRVADGPAAPGDAGRRRPPVRPADPSLAVEATVDELAALLAGRPSINVDELEPDAPSGRRTARSTHRRRSVRSSPSRRWTRCPGRCAPSVPPSWRPPSTCSPGSSPVGVGTASYTGRALVVDDPAVAMTAFEPGDVIITSATSPAWNTVLVARRRPRHRQRRPRLARRGHRPRARHPGRHRRHDGLPPAAHRQHRHRRPGPGHGRRRHDRASVSVDRGPLRRAPRRSWCCTPCASPGGPRPRRCPSSPACRRSVIDERAHGRPTPVTSSTTTVSWPGGRSPREGRERHAELLADERAAADRDAEVGARIRRLHRPQRLVQGPVHRVATARPPTVVRPATRRPPSRGRRHRATASAGAITRFGPYSVAFAAALIRLRAGDGDAFTKPLTGSYHDVWMHLHEDLLLTLDRPRSDLDEA